MVQARREIRIERPAESVFRFVGTDFYRNYPRWSPEVKHLELLDGPELRPGSRARQVRVDYRRRSESTFRVTALEPPVYLEFESLESPWFRVRYEVQPERVGRCARLRFTFELLRLEVYMRPFRRLIQKAVDDGACSITYRIKTLVEREIDPPR